VTHALQGPRIDGLWNELRLFRRIKHDAIGQLMEWRQQYGDLFVMQIRGQEVYFVTNPDHLRQLLIEQPDKLNKDHDYKSTRRGLAKFLGNGLLISDGEFWKRQRKLIAPALHIKRIASYAQAMVDYTLRMLDGWRSGATLDVNREMMHVTVRIVAKTLFNTELQADAERIGRAVDVLQNFAAERNSLLPDWIPTPTRIQTDAAVHGLDEIIFRLIRERRASGEDAGDLLSMMIAAADVEDAGEFGARMTDQQIRDEAVTMVLAGHETTSNALTWTWYLLSTHPDIEAKLHAELDTVLQGRTPTMEDLKRLPYTEWVIKESLRLYPPAFGFSRDSIADVQLHDAEHGTITIPARSNINILSYATHRDPRWWLDAETFRPERWQDENSINKYAYLPFGMGPRICVGYQFALMEAQLLLATIAQRFILRVQPGYRVEPEAHITMRVRGGLPMQLQARKPVLTPAAAPVPEPSLA
jgi:cytochrome P450